jgi:hypothetical protein
MTDVKLEDAELVAQEICNILKVSVYQTMFPAWEKKVFGEAAALLRKIPELTADLRSAQEAVLNNCARLHLAERSLAERTAELEAERTRAHNLAEYIRERV